MAFDMVGYLGSGVKNGNVPADFKGYSKSFHSPAALMRGGMSKNAAKAHSAMLQHASNVNSGGHGGNPNHDDHGRFA